MKPIETPLPDPVFTTGSALPLAPASGLLLDLVVILRLFGPQAMMAAAAAMLMTTAHNASCPHCSAP